MCERCDHLNYLYEHYYYILCFCFSFVTLLMLIAHCWITHHDESIFLNSLRFRLFLHSKFIKLKMSLHFAFYCYSYCNFNFGFRYRSVSSTSTPKADAIPKKIWRKKYRYFHFNILNKSINWRDSYDDGKPINLKFFH